MRVLQVGDSLAVDFGGTAASCAQLANHLAGVGVESSVLTLAGLSRSGRRWPLDRSVTERVCHPIAPHPLAFCPDLDSIVSSPPRPEVVHVHGLWRLHYLQASRFAMRAGLPVLVSVHGMLHDLALEEKSVSKRIARWLYQDNLLRHARCLHVTATKEADEIRRLGFEGPFAVIPWGVDVPDDGRSAALPPGARPEPSTVLYLGRLKASKGLEVLLRAWSRVAARFGNRRLVIAGSGSLAYRDRLAALSAELGVSSSVEWAGPLDGAARERAFRDAALLVLPSAYENFGLVIAEALARGVPAIATYGAPWASLADEACGWWIPVGVDPLVAALSDALSRPAGDLRAMGERGRRWARANFAWDTTARAMHAVYGWLLGCGPAPSFVTP